MKKMTLKKRRLTKKMTVRINPKKTKMNLKMLKDILVNFCQLSGVKYPNLRFLCPLLLSGGSRKGARGPSPLIFRPNWGPPNFLSCPPSPPRIPGSGWPGLPLIWRTGYTPATYNPNVTIPCVYGATRRTIELKDCSHILRHFAVQTLRRVLPSVGK